jgi:transitional endoplasmic reticulum ATPase
MSTFDDFIHISTGPAPGPGASTWPGSGSVPGDFFDNSKGLRQYTQGLIVDSIRKNHPKHHLTVTNGYIDFVGFAASRDDIICTPHGDPTQSVIERNFFPPARRYGDENGGSFMSRAVFGCYDYKFQGTDFLMYVVTGAEGQFTMPYNYILVPIEDSTTESQASCQKKADELLAAGTNWGQELHNEVLVFDQGWWQKSPELWENIQKSNWDDVILDKERKEAIIDDVIGFFNSQERYAEFGVPWKACGLPP